MSEPQCLPQHRNGGRQQLILGYSTARSPRMQGNHCHQCCRADCSAHDSSIVITVAFTRITDHPPLGIVRDVHTIRVEWLSMRRTICALILFQQVIELCAVVWKGHHGLEESTSEFEVVDAGFCQGKWNCKRPRNRLSLTRSFVTIWPCCRFVLKHSTMASPCPLAVPGGKRSTNHYYVLPVKRIGRTRFIVTLENDRAGIGTLSQMDVCKAFAGKDRSTGEDDCLAVGAHRRHLGRDKHQRSPRTSAGFFL